METTLGVVSQTTVAGKPEIVVFDPSSGEAEEIVASIEVEILDGNVVITVRRQDEARSGPISVVMV